MKKLNGYQAIVLIALAAYGTRDKWLSELKRLDKPDTPVVEAENPFPEITAALKADNRPVRTQQFANLFAGMAEFGVPKQANLIGVQQCVKLAIEMLDGNTGTEAGQLAIAEFEQVIKGMPQVIDNDSRAKIAAYYRGLSIACVEAI